MQKGFTRAHTTRTTYTTTRQEQKEEARQAVRGGANLHSGRFTLWSEKCDFVHKAPAPAPAPAAAAVETNFCLRGYCPSKTCPAHALIASMLPDGRHPHKKMRLSEVSRAMLDFYGGTIKHMYLVWHKQHLVGPLASLLGRQRSLERIMVECHEVLPQLASSIEQGCLRRVRELEMVLVLLEENEDVELPSALNHIQSLRTAMRVRGRCSPWRC